jgi:predicted deacylase
MDQVVDQCTHGIDLHTGSHHRINLPQVRAGLDDPETRRLAEAFGAPVIIDANLRDGSLRQAVKEKGIPMLLYEAGEVLRFDEMAVRTGIRGILAVMRAIGMLPGDGNPAQKAEPIITRSTTWVRASKSGILRTRMLLGNPVAQSEPMGFIADPFGNNEEMVQSPATGIIIGRSNMPLVHEGDAIFHIACVDAHAASPPVIRDYQGEWGLNHSVDDSNID